MVSVPYLPVTTVPAPALSATVVAEPPAVVAVIEVTGTSVMTLSGSLSAVPSVLTLPVAVEVPAPPALSSCTVLVLGVATGGSFTGVTCTVVVTVLVLSCPLLAASLLASFTCQLMVRSALPGSSLVLT